MRAGLLGGARDAGEERAQRGTALRSDRRASHKAAQMLEPLEIAGGHEHLGVQ
jgi:hypothetical protein